MISRTQLTARDYLEMAGIKPAKSDEKAGSPADSPRFADLLDTMRKSPESFTGSQASGLKGQDYFKNPIPAMVVVESKPRTPAALRLDAATLHPLQKKAVPSDPMPVLSENRSSGRIEEKISRSIRTASEKYRLPAQLIRGIVKAESNFQVRAVSPAGAQGLMQLMPGTARELGVTDPFDIEQNIDAGTRYLREMLDRFDGDVKLALAAYNAGPGTVQKYNGNVPYRETRNYIQKVLRYTEQYSA